MFAWSSLSRTSHFSVRGHDDRRREPGAVFEPRVQRRARSEISENSANWLTIRSSRTAVEKEGERVLVASRRSAAMPAASASSSAVKTFALLAVERSCAAAGGRLVRAVVDAPDDAVLVVPLEVVGREVQRDVGGEGPVEQPRRQAVVLRQGQPVPDRVGRDGAARGVLAEVAQEMCLQLGVVRPRGASGWSEGLVRPRPGRGRRSRSGTVAAGPATSPRRAARADDPSSRPRLPPPARMLPHVVARRNGGTAPHDCPARACAVDGGRERGGRSAPARTTQASRLGAWPRRRRFARLRAPPGFPDTARRLR